MAGLYNGFNQLTGVTSSDGTATTFGYDGNGNQVRKQDATGITQYVYDQDNRLVGIALPNGGSNAFEYDANGLRTKKTDSSGTTGFLLDGMSVVAQYAPDRTRQAWYTQSLARIDEVLSVVNGQGKFWYQTDALGSVYGLTNQAGALIGSQNYDVFGAPTPAPSGPAGQPFGFSGREHDLDAGLLYARDRYLSPNVGRWTQADRLAFVDGPNQFNYVRANPTNLTDPSGKFVVPVPMAFFAFGAAAGFLGDILGQVASQVLVAELCNRPVDLNIDWDEAWIAGLISGVAAMASPIAFFAGSRTGAGALGALANTVQYLILASKNGTMNWGSGQFWLGLGMSALTGFLAGAAVGPPGVPNLMFDERRLGEVARRLNNEAIIKINITLTNFLRSFLGSIFTNTNFIPECM